MEETEMKSAYKGNNKLWEKFHLSTFATNI